MKNIKFGILTFLMFGILVTSCKKEEEVNTVAVAAKAKAPVADAKKVSMKIDGMTCAIGCAKTIENKLSGLEGVQKAKVDFEKKEATIEYDGAVQSVESLTKTVEGVADGKTYKVTEAKSI